MKNGKKIAAASLASAVAGSVVIGASAMAATSTNSAGYPDIVQKIASKFHLNPSDVNGVFQQEHTDRQAARHQKLVTALDQAVSSSKITKDQETKILAELDSLRTAHQSSTKHDRRTERNDLRAELQQWLTDNNINVNLDDILPQPAGPMNVPTTNGQ